MKMIRRRGGWLVGFSDSIMMMRDGIPGLSVAAFFFFFLLFFLFLSCFPFFRSFLSFLMHTSRGRKAVPWGLHINERDVRRIDRETAIEIKRQTNGRPFAEENEKNQILRVLFCPFVPFSFSSKLFNSHPYSSLPTNPQQFIPYHHIHQSQSHTLINHISPRQPLFQTRILL